MKTYGSKPENLLKDGRPKYIQIYLFKKDRYADAWTVVFTRLNNWVSGNKKIKDMYLGRIWYIGMTQHGHIHHGEAVRGSFYPGTKITWDDLNVVQKEAVIAEYEACWRVTITHVNGVCTKIWRNEVTEEAV